MAAQVLVETYRTQEIKELHKFEAVCTLTYFGDTVFISGMSGNFSIAAWRELRAYLESIGIKEANYFRRGKLNIIK